MFPKFYLIQFILIIFSDLDSICRKDQNQSVLFIENHFCPLKNFMVLNLCDKFDLSEDI